jgi:hypothetical protein
MGTGYTNEPDPSSAATQMRLTVQVQLLADADQRAALQATLALTNQAASLGSEIAWQRGAFRAYDLQQLAYGQIRTLGLSAQPAVRVIKKVADAAQPYDDRCLSWQPDQQTVSIWTVAGRLKGIRFAVGEQQRKLLAYRKGDSPPTPTTSSPSASWPRLNAPAVASPWKTSEGSAAGSGSASPSGPRCTPGRSTNSAPSSATRRYGPESWSST